MEKRRCGGGSSRGEREDGVSKLKKFIAAGRKSLKDQLQKMKLKKKQVIKSFCIEEFGLDIED